MLGDSDVHNQQAATNLGVTLEYGRQVLENLGVLGDYEHVYQAIKTHLEVQQSIITSVQNFALSLPPEVEQKVEEFGNLERYEQWLPVIDDTEAHFQFQSNIDKFKSQYKVSHITHI
jgi:hypothetical protein